MDFKDIPDSYWKQQEQILRDNGQGRELSRSEKEILADDLIEKQRESITSWTNYLGDKNCPYPLWFKVYAFDGISKMSNALNLDDANYDRRDHTTALSFPKLNAEILAKVYRQINNFYGVDKEDWLKKNSDDEKLVSLVKSANFPKLYAKELLDTKVILKTPERAEDVHGDWFEYKLGDEEEIADLAEGTRWCVVDPNVAHNYLTYGQFINPGEDNNYDDDDWEDDDQTEYPEAKFIIFRLEDPNSPGVYASNGSASIRLDPDGMVAEVSGLGEGQAIEDALVPTVKKKTLSLPGGEKYLQKFDDKQTLIRLDKKMKKGQDLTKEELSFLYELDRPIATLDTYNRRDPRIPELKEKYNVEYALEKGLDIDKIISSLGPNTLIQNLDSLIKYGADIDNITSNIDSYDIAANLDTLLDHGANIDVNELASELNSYDIFENLDTLLKNGADIDLIVGKMKSHDIVYSLDFFLNHGANININKLVSNLSEEDIAKKLDILLEHGADIDNIINCMDSDDIAKNLNHLLRCGADVYNIAYNLDLDNISFHLDTLLEHGADINHIVNDMDSYEITIILDALLQHGADVNLITEKLSKKEIEDNIDILREYGANL